MVGGARNQSRRRRAAPRRQSPSRRSPRTRRSQAVARAGDQDRAADGGRDLGGVLPRRAPEFALDGRRAVRAPVIAPFERSCRVGATWRSRHNCAGPLTQRAVARPRLRASLRRRGDRRRRNACSKRCVPGGRNAGDGHPLEVVAKPMMRSASLGSTACRSTSTSGNIGSPTTMFRGGEAATRRRGFAARKGQGNPVGFHAFPPPHDHRDRCPVLAGPCRA